MELFEITRTLIDIESITGNEQCVGLWLLDYLSGLAARYGGQAERSEVEPAARISSPAGASGPS